MNLKEYLFSQLGEEAGEIAQMCSKINRFGLDEVWKPEVGPNRERLIAEINDLFGVIEVLQELGHLPAVIDRPEQIAAKKEKVWKYAQYAREQGTLSLTLVELGELLVDGECSACGKGHPGNCLPY